MLVLRKYHLAPTEPDDHPKLRGIDPPLNEQIRLKTKEILIDEELRRRR
jgi:DnaJ family protein C protein 8